MELSTLTDRLDERLDTDAYADVDASANGLQVGPGDPARTGRDSSPAVDHVAFAVDAAAATIEDAAAAGADVLVTHHGLVWGGLDRVTGREYENVAALVENDLALYVSHLPLDGHGELGNAAGLADFLGLDVDSREPFGTLGPVTIGQRGRASDAYDVAELRERLAGLDTGGREPRVLDFGPEEIRDVAIVTGSGVDWLGEAADAGVDALVTGEGKQQVYHEAREAGVNVFLAGHYATETFGVGALSDLVSEWGIETTVLDHPTGL
ncbi:Nif3-like dinuclear metal center hexameric protein [Halobellus limi]|uniref:Dinuclear metal center protein, YbgI/SA1388 family n=1 Tax=Halobellus limi TaxID=699433 RepID=A0A1H5VA24_9EURY|nr:Nif3-like dinuclear metal center hexameric protein [Halobellus limi]QCC46786.1 Nif3-like dinuclear metal center hexameric protein [Halobellus limi]SEF83621.1 dinuclear metal center protein, YbgI/SA1388 family [Halobellus limi]